jgi:hypothetical protein
MYLLRLALWATCVTVGWIGAGTFVTRLFGLRESRWALRGVAGVALFVLVGGWLNLAGAVRPRNLIALVIIGDALFVAYAFTARSAGGRQWRLYSSLPVWGRALAVLCGIAMLIAAINSLTYSKFSDIDDLNAYLSFPVKLLQGGSLGFDPFSERRVQSGLGASYFLQAFMLVAGDVRSLWFCDFEAGLIFFAGCVYFAGRRLGNSAELSLTLVALALAIPLSHGNLTMNVLPAALFTGLFLVENSGETAPLSRSFLLGLLGATVAALKSTYLPPSIVMIVLLHLARLVRGQRWVTTLRDMAVSGLVYGGILWPWMLDMRRKEGTYFYPLLGKGYEISAYGPVPHMIKAGAYPVVLGTAMLILFVGAAAVHWMVTRGRGNALAVTVMLLACGLVALPISISVVGASLLRYTAPFELPCCLLFLGSLLGLSQESEARPRWLRLGYLYAAVLLLTLGEYSATHSNFDLYVPAHRRAGLRGILDEAALKDAQQRAARLQAAVPAGEAIYADYMVTFPMDFQRNPIYIADFPGMASLPPGMPTQNSPEGLRTYLLAKHIRYIAFSRERVHGQETVLRFTGSAAMLWPKIQVLNSIDVQHEIEALALTSRVVFDDGDDRVLDLLN